MVPHSVIVRAEVEPHVAVDNKYTRIHDGSHVDHSGWHPQCGMQTSQKKKIESDPNAHGNEIGVILMANGSPQEANDSWLSNRMHNGSHVDHSGFSQEFTRTQNGSYVDHA